MSFMDKLMFWKKDPLDSVDNSPMPNDGMGRSDFGVPDNMQQAPPNDWGRQDELGLPSSKGMPDFTKYRGVGNQESQNLMNQSIREQLGNDYMNPDVSQGYNNLGRGGGAIKAQNNNPSDPNNNEIQLVSAKLDAIKATMDAINQRLANLERIAYAEDDSKGRVQW
jgi:hypothetical protein